MVSRVTEVTVHTLKVGTVCVVLGIPTICCAAHVGTVTWPKIEPCQTVLIVPVETYLTLSYSSWRQIYLVRLRKQSKVCAVVGDKGLFHSLFNYCFLLTLVYIPLFYYFSTFCDSQFVVIKCSVSIVESPDMLSEEADPKMQGLEKFETIMLSLGLSERKPIPEPISFPEPDPLGASLVVPNARQDDVSLSLGENDKQNLALIEVNVFISSNFNLFTQRLDKKHFKCKRNRWR